MIELYSVTKAYGRWHSRQYVLDDITAVFERAGNYVILGQRGAGKSTLLRLLSGVATPTRGSIARKGSVGLPVGYGSLLTTEDSGQRLAAFLAELYDVDSGEVVEFASEFSGLGDDIRLPISALSTGARTRLYYALGYAIPVDCYLFDSTVAAGDDAEFRERCQQAFETRRDEAATIVATRNARRASDYGDRGGVLHDGKLHLFDTVDAAVDMFEEIELDAQAGTLSYAETLIKDGEQSKAREYLRNYIADQDDNVGAYELLADLALSSGNYTEAANACRAALEREPESIDAHFTLARIAERTNRPRDAVAHAQDVLERAPDHRDATLLLARNYEELNLNQEAATIWRGLAADNTNSVTLRLAIRADIKAGNWKRVIEHIEASGPGLNHNKAMMQSLARALIETGRNEEAIRAIVHLARLDFERAISVVYQLIRKRDFALIVEILEALQPFDLTARLESRTLRLTLILLEKEAVTARKEGRESEAATLQQTVDAIDPDRLRRAKTEEA